MRVSLARGLVAVLCAALLVPGELLAYPQDSAAAAAAAATDADAPKLPADQLDAIVAPIALYPDDLLAQVMAASTYPLEIVQLQQWLAKNSSLKDKALVDAVGRQPWDPSVQGLASLPDVVKRLSDDISWTTDLGNAFLAQQSDVMDAVQRMRQKAQGTGALKSSDQQKVETKVVEQKTVIVVQQSNPQVVYVPTYNPVVVYGPPVYPYPPIYYPPYNPGAVVAAGMISFGVGIAIGAAWGGAWGGWGYHCGWGHSSNININVNNNYIRNTNINNVNRGGGGGGNSWQHNPQHRGGAPYSNRSTANQYGGSTRGGSGSNRPGGGAQANARQQAGSRPVGGPAGGQGAGGATNRAAGAGASARPGGGRSGGNGGGDRIGSRDIPKSTPSKSGSAFGGGSGGGFNGSSAKASSSRGASSMGSRGGGGGGGRSGGGGGHRR